MPVVKQIKKHKILFDTHVWVWLVLGDKKISKSFKIKAEELINSDLVYISPISIWEVGMLVEKRRLEVDRDCMDWIESALEGTRVNIAPISPRIAIQSTRLPEGCHGDPADRLLIATARGLNALLVTHDEKILQYGQGSFISVYDPV